MISKTCKYAIKACVYIYTQTIQDKKVDLNSIRTAIDSPKDFTSKILQTLKKNNILSSTKGIGGGFEMNRDIMKTLKVYDIIKITDGDNIFYECLLGLDNCSNENPCPVHDNFKEIRDLIKNKLSQKTIKELSEKVEEGEAVLKRILTK